MKKQALKALLLCASIVSTTAQAASAPIENFSQLPAADQDAAITSIRGDISYGSNTPIIISHPGTYRLVGPLKASNGVTALTLSADNVTLDLAGNTISGGATGIAITGNNATVKNGTIQNSSEAGIIITGTECQLNALDVVSSNTGFLLLNTHANSIFNCRALNSAGAGFSLVSSYTNTIANCQALNTNGGTSAAYGFISHRGSGNNFSHCIAQNTQTQSTATDTYTAGFLLSSENASTLSKSQALSTLSLASTTTAFGIFLNNTHSCICTQNSASNSTTASGLGIGISADTSLNHVAQNSAYNNDINYQDVAATYITSPANARGVYNIDAAASDPDMLEPISSMVDLIETTNQSIESCAQTSNSKLDALSQTLISQPWSIESKLEVASSAIDSLNASLNVSIAGQKDPLALKAAKAETTSSALSSDWLTYSGKNYIAVGSAASTADTLDNTLNVYHYTGSTLDTVATATVPQNFVNSVSWQSATAPYLATGGIYLCPSCTPQIQNKVSVYQFTGNTLDHKATASTFDKGTTAVSWFPGTDYLAAGGIDTDEVRVYHYTGTSLDLVATATTPGWNEAFSVDCLVNGSKKYVAAGGAAGSTPNSNTITTVYEFTNSSLEQLDSIITSSLDQVWSVAWLAGQDGTKYLAICGIADSQPLNKELIKVYKLTGSSLDLVATPTASANTWSTSVAWLAEGENNYLAVGGTIETGATKQPLMRIFKLNGSALQLLATYTPSNPGQELTVAFLKDALSNYIATGGTTGTYPNSTQTLSTFRFVQSTEQDTIPVTSKLDYLLSCPFTPIVASGTTTSNKQFITGPVLINQSGTYCLSGNCSGGITLNGNNITLDLNKYTITGGTNGLTVNGNQNTIRNGTISEATNSGVSLSGNNCILENLDVTDTPTGFYIANSTANLLNQCHAQRCTHNGFLLANSTSNIFSGCTVANLRGTENTLNGFYSANGQDNTFDGCSVNGISSTAAQSTASGFKFNNENYSKVTNCSIQDMSTTQETANIYGIYAPMSQNQQASYDNDTAGRGVAWLEYTGNRYLALGSLSGTGDQLTILKYTGTPTLTRVAGADWAYAIQDTAWFQTGTATYIACGVSDSTTDNILVYRFTQPDTLSTTPATYTHGATVSDIASLIDRSTGTPRCLLALAGNPVGSTNPVRVLQFNPNGGDNPPGTITTLANYATNDQTANSCDWLVVGSKKYLAVGLSSGTATEIRVIEFTGTALNDTTALVEMTRTMYAVHWLTTSTGKYYLAACGVGQPQALIFEFNPVALTLTQIATYTHNTTNLLGSCAWLPGIDDLNYLAVAGYASNEGHSMKVLRFDGSCLTPLYNYTGTTIYNVDWLTTGSTLLAAAVSSTTGTASVIGFSPTRNTITNNTVTNVRGGTNATAFAVDANNYLLNNIATNNDTNYYYTPEYGDSNSGY